VHLNEFCARLHLVRCADGTRKRRRSRYAFLRRHARPRMRPVGTSRPPALYPVSARRIAISAASSPTISLDYDRRVARPHVRSFGSADRISMIYRGGRARRCHSRELKASTIRYGPAISSAAAPTGRWNPPGFERGPTQHAISRAQGRRAHPVFSLALLAGCTPPRSTSPCAWGGSHPRRLRLFGELQRARSVEIIASRSAGPLEVRFLGGQLARIPASRLRARGRVGRLSRE